MLLRAAGNKAVAGLVADHRADPVIHPGFVRGSVFRLTGS
jgi:hypothetical protein